MDGGSKVYVHDKRLMCTAHEGVDSLLMYSSSSSHRSPNAACLSSICQKYRHLFHDI